MNRSRSVSETSVGLFAFLDVLMSTMGSLILVLMVVTPKIRQEAVAKAAVAAHHATDVHGSTKAKHAEEKKPPPYVPPVVEPPREMVDLNAKLKVELAELSHETQEQKRVTEAKLEELGTAQASLAKNQAELDALEKRLEAILRGKRRLAESVAKTSNDGIAVESQLSSTAARLRTIRGEIARSSTSYTFVAYDGISGTTRRPILIECEHGHVTFLQEGVTLSASDLSGFSPQYNPVQAGAQALLDYWSIHSAPGDPRPYVLIVVRPSGTVAYYEARHLLERMKDPFGYELLPADQKLDVPPPVPEAAEACRKAVEKAIAERVDIFKDLFANGSGLGGKKPGGSNDPFQKALGGNAKPASPFDDVGSKGTTPSEASASSGTGTQPAGNGAPGSASVAQSQTGNSGTASTLQGFSGNGPSPGGPSPGGPSNTGTTPGTGSGTGMSGDRQAGVMLSDTGPLGTGRTNGEAGGTSVMGIGTPGANSSGVVRPGSGDGSGGGLLTGGLNGPGTSSGGPSPGGPNPGGSSIGGAGFGPASNAGPSGANGLGPGGSQTVQGTPGTPGLNGPGSTGPGGAPHGVPVAGSPVSGTLGGGLPSLNGSNVGTPSAGLPGTLPGSPGGPPGSPGAPTGSPGMGGPGEGTPGTAGGALASDSEFPPSIIPRSGGGDSPGLGTGSDKLAIGHPTSGSGPGASGNETADGQGDSSSGQSAASEAGAIPRSVAGASQSGQFAPMQSGSIQSGSTQPGSSQFGSAPGGVGEGGTGQVASDSGTAASPQSGDAGAPSTPSTTPPDPSQVGGMPSFGSPPSGATAAADDGGGSPAGSENPTGGKPDNGALGLAASGDDYDEPRRRNQQTAYRWGISSPRASIGYEHDARIYIERNRIYVGSQAPILCGRGESSQQLSLAVIRALNREARTWGRPRVNFYWVPSPNVVVLAGGLVQYERIEPTFERHALNWTVEYRTELSRPAPLPRLVTE